MQEADRRPLWAGRFTSAQANARHGSVPIEQHGGFEGLARIRLIQSALEVDPKANLERAVPGRQGRGGRTLQEARRTGPRTEAPTHRGANYGMRRVRAGGSSRRTGGAAAPVPFAARSGPTATVAHRSRPAATCGLVRTASSRIHWWSPRAWGRRCADRGGASCGDAMHLESGSAGAPRARHPVPWR